MGFESVIFNHGSKEFGKDYILTEMTKINTFRYYGVEKIRYKISKGIYGAVRFLDKEDIENLIIKYWKA